MKKFLLITVTVLAVLAVVAIGCTTTTTTTTTAGGTTTTSTGGTTTTSTSTTTTTVVNAGLRVVGSMNGWSFDASTDCNFDASTDASGDKFILTTKAGWDFAKFKVVQQADTAWDDSSTIITDKTTYGDDTEGSNQDISGDAIKIQTGGANNNGFNIPGVGASDVFVITLRGVKSAGAYNNSSIELSSDATIQAVKQ